MTRIDPDTLATHLEDALSSAPVDTLAALQTTAVDAPPTLLRSTLQIAWDALRLPAMDFGRILGSRLRCFGEIFSGLIERNCFAAVGPMV